jgi:hypothetical protein
MSTKVDGLQVDDEVAKLVKHAESQGWTVTSTRNRLKFTPPGSNRPVFVPRALSHGRGLQNVLSELHRAGLDDEPGGNVRYQDGFQPVDEPAMNAPQAETWPDGAKLPGPDTTELDTFLLTVRMGIVDLLDSAGADEAHQWQRLAEESERRLAEVEAERDSAMARAEKAEGEIGGMRQAMRAIMGD